MDGRTVLSLVMALAVWRAGPPGDIERVAAVLRTLDEADAAARDRELVNLARALVATTEAGRTDYAPLVKAALARWSEAVGEEQGTDDPLPWYLRD